VDINRSVISPNKTLKIKFNQWFKGLVTESAKESLSINESGDVARQKQETDYNYADFSNF